MNRREFINGLLKLGISVALADKLELFERINYKRRFFPGHKLELKTYSLGFAITQEMIDDDIYGPIFEPMQKVVRIKPMLVRPGRRL